MLGNAGGRYALYRQFRREEPSLPVLSYLFKQQLYYMPLCDKFSITSLKVIHGMFIVGEGGGFYM